ncbi:MAG: hypothetical protein NW201_14895 [Gemmatimonadales bacterium]|nr:hypothetical protein [Gemmatimonadales bacterium]
MLLIVGPLGGVDPVTAQVSAVARLGVSRTVPLENEFHDAGVGLGAGLVVGGRESRWAGRLEALVGTLQGVNHAALSGATLRMAAVHVGLQRWLNDTSSFPLRPYVAAGVGLGGARYAGAEDVGILIPREITPRFFLHLAVGADFRIAGAPMFVEVVSSRVFTGAIPIDFLRPTLGARIPL